MDMINKLCSFEKSTIEKLQKIDKKKNPIRSNLNNLIRQAVKEFLEKTEKES